MDGKEIERTCPTCGATVRTTIGEARRAPALQCPSGHLVTFEAEDFDRDIRAAEQRIENIMKSFRFG